MLPWQHRDVGCCAGNSRLVRDGHGDLTVPAGVIVPGVVIVRSADCSVAGATAGCSAKLCKGLGRNPPLALASGYAACAARGSAPRLTGRSGNAAQDESAVAGGGGDPRRAGGGGGFARASVRSR